MTKQINVTEEYLRYLKNLPICGIYIRLNRVQDFIEILNKKSTKGQYELTEKDTENWRKTEYTLKFGGIEMSKSTSPTKLIENLGGRHFLIVN